jgi:hypothetical protein
MTTRKKLPTREKPKRLTNQPVGGNNPVITQRGLENFIIEWNNKNPLDYFWRKKYNIPFGSADHKSITFLDQAIDYHEERLMKIHRENEAKKQNKEENALIGLEVDKEIIKMGKTQIDEEFDNLKLEDFMPSGNNEKDENLLKDKQ